MSGGESKEQYCIGTWNVRSMNQGELEVVKQEMASVNIDNLAIIALKWMEMGEFNSDDYCIYYCGQKSIRRNDRLWPTGEGNGKPLQYSSKRQDTKR